MIDLKRVQEYINLGWSKEEALEMVKNEDKEEVAKASSESSEIEALKNEIEELKKSKEETQKEESKKEEDSFIEEEDKPIDIKEAFKNIFG